MTEAEWIAFLQRPEIPAFNRAMLERPEDDLPRLVFADWVEENCPNRRTSLLIRRSISRPEEAQICPGFPLNGSVDASFHRARLVLMFAGRTWDISRPWQEQLDFLTLLFSSGWVGGLAIRLSGLDVARPHPYLGEVIQWRNLETLTVGGQIGHQSALYAFVLCQPGRFPNLSVLTHHGDSPVGDELERWLASPFVHQLA